MVVHHDVLVSCWIRLSIRTSSQTKIESLLWRFSRDATLALDKPLHGNPPITRIATALNRIASLTNLCAPALSNFITSSNNCSMMLFVCASWFANVHLFCGGGKNEVYSGYLGGDMDRSQASK